MKGLRGSCVVGAERHCRGELLRKAVLEAQWLKARRHARAMANWTDYALVRHQRAGRMQRKDELAAAPRLFLLRPRFARGRAAHAGRARRLHALKRCAGTTIRSTVSRAPGRREDGRPVISHEIDIPPARGQGDWLPGETFPCRSLGTLRAIPVRRHDYSVWTPPQSSPRRGRRSRKGSTYPVMPFISQRGRRALA